MNQLPRIRDQMLSKHCFVKIRKLHESFAQFKPVILLMKLPKSRDVIRRATVGSKDVISAMLAAIFVSDVTTSTAHMRFNWLTIQTLLLCSQNAIFN